MVTVLENQKIDDNIFKSLETEKPNEYNNIFGEIDSDNLYYMFVDLCGEKGVTNICKTLDNSELSKVILARYSDNWQQVKNAIGGDYDVFKPYNITEEVAENITANETSTGTNKNTSAVYAFNSGDIVDSDENLTEKDNTVDNTQTRDNTIKKTGNSGNKSPAVLLKEEIEIRKTVYYEEVLKDIMNYLTLDVYQ